ncbi:MAG: Ig-like domain-containing protein [Prevotellaceae bacterium]|jgi:uncharacterized protein YjdB|nr:Ig-like domain-containing protein [Prevotellaceae bacterium]
MKKSKILSGIMLSAMIMSIALVSCHKHKNDPKIPVTGVKLNKQNISLVIGKQEVLLPNVAPPNATNKKVTWKAQNAGIATVDATGKVTGVAAGKTTIIVTTADRAKTDSCIVTVVTATVPVQLISLTPATAIVAVSKTLQIKADITPANATNTKVTWKSSDDKIATVDATGLVTGKTKGEATIKATTDDGGRAATCSVTVTE